MSSLLDPKAREELRARAALLRPDAQPRWGRFTAPRMLGHLIQSLRMMTGELPIRAEPGPWIIRKPPLKQLLIYVLPFPKGMDTFPELLARPAKAAGAMTEAEWAAERAEFERALSAVGDRSPTERWPDHGALGPLTGRQWGALQYRHLDFHFRQFGV